MENTEFIAKRPILLTIAGSDNTGGAGIQADIKTACHFKVYAASAITAVTAQNCHGVAGVLYVGDDMLRKQLETFLECYHPNAVKIGMIPCKEAVPVIADIIRKYDLHNVVLDPVMAATQGGSLSGDSVETMKEMISELFPLCAVITPNLPEYEFVTVKFGLDCFKSAESMLLKDGHGDDVNCTDRLHIFGDSPKEYIYPSNRLETEHTHGTGCVLSSAIACGLAKGESIPTAVGNAKKFVDHALMSGMDYPVTEHYGPLDLL